MIVKNLISNTAIAKKNISQNADDPFQGYLKLTPKNTLTLFDYLTLTHALCIDVFMQ